MKKKAIPPFTLTAGQSGRLLFTFTLPEGTAKPNLRGALMVHGQKVDMLAGDDDSLTIPPLPAGVYLAEVRAAGMCVLYGHVEVLPSPLFEDSGMAAYRVDVDNTTDVLQVSLSMVEGIPGMQGVKGDTGAPGSTAYELAVKHGYEGSEEDWVGELQGAQEAANMSKQYAGEASTSATRANESAYAAAQSRSDANRAAGAAGNSATAAENYKELAAAAAQDALNAQVLAEGQCLAYMELCESAAQDALNAQVLAEAAAMSEMDKGV